jgi:hypothetical protein
MEFYLSQHLALLKRFSEVWMFLLEVVHAVFQVLNQIIQDNVDLLENAIFIAMVISFPSFDSNLLHNGYARHYVKMMSLLFCGVCRC